MKNVSRPNSTAVKDIDDISTSPTFLGHKYRYRIVIGKGAALRVDVVTVHGQ